MPTYPKILSSQRKKICDQAIRRWEDFHQVTQLAEKMVPAPFNIPIQFFNAASTVLAKYIKNTEDLEALMTSLTRGVKDIDVVLGEKEESDKYDVELRKLAEETFSNIMNGLEKIEESERHRSLVAKVFRQDKVGDTIKDAVTNLKETLESYDRKMTTGLAAGVHKLDRAAALSALRGELVKYTASNARFNASVKNGWITFVLS